MVTVTINMYASQVMLMLNKLIELMGNVRRTVPDLVVKGFRIRFRSVRSGRGNIGLAGPGWAEGINIVRPKGN